MNGFFWKKSKSSQKGKGFCAKDRIFADTAASPRRAAFFPRFRNFFAAVFAAAFVFSANAFSDNYWWTGAGDGTSWGDPENWSTDENGTSADTAPCYNEYSADNINFSGSTSVTLTVPNDLINSIGTMTATGEAAITLNITSDISISSLATHSSAGANFTLNVDSGGTLSVENFNIQSSSGYDVSLTLGGSGTVSVADFSIKSTSPNESTVTVEANTFFNITNSCTFENYSDSARLTFGGSGSLALPAAGITGANAGGNVTVSPGLAVLQNGINVEYESDNSGLTLGTVSIEIQNPSVDTTFNYEVKVTPIGGSEQTKSGTFTFSQSGATTQTFTPAFPAGITKLSSGSQVQITVKSSDGQTEYINKTYTYIAISTDVFYWTGAVSSAWDEASNWSHVSPESGLTQTAATDFPNSATSTAIVPATLSGGTAISNFPQVSSAASVASLQVDAGASVAIESGGTLTVNAYEGGGKITLNGGTLETDFSSSTTISEIQVQVARKSEIKTLAGATGQVTISKLSGSGIAKISNSSGKKFSIDSYENNPSINVVTGNDINLSGGTIGSLTVQGGVVRLRGSLTATSDVESTGGYIVGGGNDFVVQGNLTCSANIGDSSLSNPKLNSITVSGTTTIASGGIIKTIGNQTYTGDVTNAGTVTAENAAAITFAGNFTNSGSFTTSGSQIAVGRDFTNESGGTFSVADSEVEVTGNFTNAGEYSGTGSKIEVTGDVTNAGTVTAENAAAITFEANFTNSGSFTTSGSQIAVAGDFANESGSTFSVADSEVEIAGDFTNAGEYSGTGSKLTLGGDFDNAGTFSDGTAEITATGGTGGAAEIKGGANGIEAASFTYSPASGSGSLTINGDNTFEDFSANATGDVFISINGSNSFTNFSAGDEASGLSGTLTISGTQTVTGTLSLFGKGESEKLTIAGDGEFKISSAQSGKFLTVNKSAVQVVADGGGTLYFTALDSAYDDGTSGIHNGWKIIGDTITWTGAVSSAWDAAENWDLGIVPGVAAQAGGLDTTGIKVVIPTSPSGGANFPVASAEYTVRTLAIGDNSVADSMAAGVPSLEVSGAGGIKVTGPAASSSALENFGRIIYSGEGRISDENDAPLNDAANGGTVEYASGADALTDFGTTDYHNLIVDGGASLSGTGQIVVGGKTQIAAGTELQAASIKFEDDVQLGAGAVSLKANVELAAAKTMTAGSGAEVTFDGNFTNSGSFTTSGSQISVAGDVTNESGATFSVADSEVEIAGDFTNAGEYSGTGSKLTLGGDFDNTSGTFGDSTAEITATGTAAEIKGGTNGIAAASFTYSPAGGSVSLSISGDNSFTNFSANEAKDGAGLSGTLTISGEQAVSGTLKLFGKGESDHLTIAGGTDGKFKISSAQSGKFLTVNKGAVQIVDDGGGTLYFTALDSAYDDGTFGIHNGWKIIGDTITWTGAVSSAWDAAENWDLGIVPGVAAQAISGLSGSLDTRVYKVVIPTQAGTPPAAPANWPAASAEYTVRTLAIGDGTISDSMAAGVPSLEVSGAGGIKVTGPAASLSALENFGKIIYSGEGRISDENDAPLNDAANGGTVEYSGDGTLTDFAAGASADYHNLIVDGGANLSGTGQIVVGGKTQIGANATLSATLIELQGEAEMEDGVLITADANLKSDVVLGGSVSINGDVRITEDAAQIGQEIGTQNLAIDGDLYVDANAGQTKTFFAKVSAKNFLLYGGTLSLNADLSLESDAILLGANYNIADAESGVDDLFKYDHEKRDGATHAKPSFTGDFPQTKNASLQVAQGVKISVEKNFYANGISITAAGEWTLEIPDNDSQKSAFAELYNCEIANCKAQTSAGGEAFVAAAEGNKVTNCQGVATSRLAIKAANTKFDDVIKITLKYVDQNGADLEDAVYIENSNGEIARAAENLSLQENIKFDFYSDENCAQKYSASSSEDAGPNASGETALFLKLRDSKNAWNTDATGKTAGNAESTNFSGAHSEVVPKLDIPKAAASLYETLRDKHKNRIKHYSGAGKIFTDVTDGCPPVLVAVYTGQENHIDGTGQPFYDAHNFIEFQYSEPVQIGEDENEIKADAENIQATNAFGAISASASGGIEVAGLGIFSSGKVDAALKPGIAGDSPHSLYRKFSVSAGGSAAEQTYRIRVSIAGYVSGTVEGGYKNWAGYINSAERPKSGSAATPAKNAKIFDLAKDANGGDAKNQIYAAAQAGGPSVPQVKVNAKVSADAQDLYGAWDVTPPSFAPMRINGKTEWKKPKTDGSQEYELVYMGGTQAAIEAHMFDNEPAYTSNEVQWFSRFGWANADAQEPTAYDGNLISDAADIVGGAQPFAAGASTKGGIRYCSLFNASKAFSFKAGDSSSYAQFKDQDIKQGAQSTFFLSAQGQGNEIDSEDGHYFKLWLDVSALGDVDAETIFTVKFDSNECVITDLAGNRIKCGTIEMKSIDRTPPEFILSAAPLGQDKLLVVFSKQVNVTDLVLYEDGAAKSQKVDALKYIPKSLSLTNGSGTGNQIDDSVAAKVAFKTKKATGIIFTLKKNATLKDVTGCFIEAKSEKQMYDPISGILAELTYIQDGLGNYIKAGKKHAFSDFAIGAVNMQYAYAFSDGADESLKFDESRIGRAARDWSANQSKKGTVVADKEIIMHASLSDGTDDNSGGMELIGGVTALFDSSPDEDARSVEFNDISGKELRVWLPEIFESLALVKNEIELSFAGEIPPPKNSESKSFVNFDIPEETVCEKWELGDQVEFLFTLDGLTVDHFADGENVQPLYCLRLEDEADITSLDLWSFKLGTSAAQRGGVTIFNNVINVNAGEETSLQVEIGSPGNLSVIVMTLDGNIVKYLQRGRVEEGIYNFTWDGTNKGGSPVARGLYFVRIMGCGIDETRKVMCVKK